MILFVSSIVKQPMLRLFLSDGHYEIEADFDPEIALLINSGRIQTGMKLMIVNSQVTQAKLQKPHHPLDKNCERITRLSIQFNSLFPCSWSANLGHIRTPGLPLNALSQIKRDGGMISMINFLLDRVYPVQVIFRENSSE